MSKTTIKLEDSTARQIYKTAAPELKRILEESFPKGFFSTKITDRIDDFSDILKELGKTLDEVIPWKNPKTKEQKSQNALAKIQCITEVYNERVQIDFNNDNQRKWYLWWERKSSGWVLDWVSCICSFALVGFGCYFTSEENARDAANKFKDIFIDYLPE